MPKAKADAKSVELLKLIAQLRAHVDIHRIIALNVDALHGSEMSTAFIGYLQKSAHEALAIYICKIFESSGRNELNSIPGIIGSLSPLNLSEAQKRDFAAFGRMYGNHAIPVEVVSYLRATFGLFCGVHSDSLLRLKEFRDTIGAHSDSKAAIKALPSHAEFEILFSFANDFYRLIARAIHGFGPATIPRAVGPGFIKLMQLVGMQSPRFDFNADE
jgi:HEPN superfamily AbiU2-like protein